MSLIGELERSVGTGTRPTLERADDLRPASVTAQCLVLSVSPQRRQMLVRSANEAGWDTVACAHARSAWQTAQRERFAMALVDLETAAGGCIALYRDLTEHIIASQKTLALVCGHEGNAAEEIWARQIGVWLYLPGVTVDCDIRSLCAEAMPVAVKVFRQREMTADLGS